MGLNARSLRALPVLILFTAAPGMDAAMSLTLTPSIPPPAPVGQIVTWTAAAEETPGPVWYRFRARRSGGDFRTIRDYGPESALDWTVSEHEGTYEVEVSAQDQTTGEVSAAAADYQIASRLDGGAAAAIHPTANPMVFLYSAAPCGSGARMKVIAESSTEVIETPWKPCRTGLSMNFYLAGLHAGTSYSVRHTVASAVRSSNGPPLSLTTPAVPMQFAGYQVLSGGAHLPPGILLQSTLFEKTVATDLRGNVVWFYPGDISYLTRPEEGGLFFGVREHPFDDPSRQIVREFDLAGTTIRETNAARVSRQLAALGKPPITGFHHEARSLPGGRVLVLASREQILTDVQGPGAHDVIGDVILVLDQDLQVEWSWDAFDHLDTRRTAVLGETCTPTGGGCPPFYLAPQANDWLHGNAVQMTPDGNLLYSARHQDWLIKIDYRYGQGSGDVLWRLGPGGDFTIDSADSNPWFSHQHDPNFVPGAASTLALFDNGNVRYAADNTAHSRGQVMEIDEERRTAKLVLNADIGSFSFALGSAQRLPNSDYHFEAGWRPDQTSISLEIDPSGNIVYGVETSAVAYRSFRMPDLYGTYERQQQRAPARTRPPRPLMEE